MTDKWTNCYDDSWKDQIVPEAFSHPAKMSYGLINRIFTHAQEQGWLDAQSIICDCFGGISTTGIIAAYRGYRSVTVELEPKFTNLAMQNVRLHKAKWDALKCPYPVIIQGDSRKLCELVESASLIVSSPPFQASSGAMANPESYKGFEHVGSVKHKSNDSLAGYGNSPGQLGAMKPGDISLIVSSPPYQGSLTDKPSDSVRKMHGANMGRSALGDGYGKTEGNLGNLKAGDVSLILSSPPYEKAVSGGGAGIDFSKTKRDGDVRHHSLRSSQGKVPFEYSKAENNLGNQQGDTFWAVSLEIVRQCYQILRPGGKAIFVCKDFVRKGERVPFSDDWLKLCEAVGFKLVCRHRAMLVKEETKDSLFGGTITKTKERKSFFRRLAESKGSPRIDEEDVICVMKEGTE